MKKGLYIVNLGYKITDEKRNTDGVIKKILGQVNSFNKLGFNVELLNVAEKKNNYICKFFYSWFNKKQYISKNYDFLKDVDFVYIRHFSPINRGCIGLLSYLKKNNCKIIYEVPTYPYDKEHAGFKGFIFLLIDKFFRKFLNRYVDYIATYSDDNSIFNIPTIKITNGIDCLSIPTINNSCSTEDINLIAVAQFSKWHGYDRLIEGLNNYYECKPSRKVFINFVGAGPELETYKKKVINYNLSSYIVFHGLLSGQKLNMVFDRSNMAVCSLGCHRIGIYKGSFLKSREYMARGLPMISSTKIDVLDAGFPYIYYVPEDESAININSLINFYNKLKELESRANQISNIRRFAEDSCDMTVVMKPVVNVISELLQDNFIN
ncbi:glycosyltransferase [Treponema sp. OMZ 788]|uniref:glycosyltransferase n=1 Tax=Treponema sp. OMZ 788 TaxID=2563664 RepID=UPI0020A30DE9|nr:glycosyltransferase [Treponema sp. OMZ 788]UTC65433.1 glycosyltransferase [Treponema sp. OMZ 788]